MTHAEGGSLARGTDCTRQPQSDSLLTSVKRRQRHSPELPARDMWCKQQTSSVHTACPGRERSSQAGGLPSIGQEERAGEGSWEAAASKERVQGRGPTQKARGTGSPPSPLARTVSVRSGGMEASSQLPCLSPGPPVSREWEKAKCPTSQRLLSNRSLGGGPRAWREEGSRALSRRISCHPGRGDSRTKPATGPTCGSPGCEPQAHSTAKARLQPGPSPSLEASREGLPKRTQPAGASSPAGSALPCSLGIAAG